MKYNANACIGLLSIVAVVGIFVTSGEAAISALQGTRLESILNALSYRNSIIFNLCIGFLVAALVWFLNVYLPERQVRRLLRTGLESHYRRFRHDVIAIILYSYSGDLPAQLVPLENFRDHFKKEGANPDEWTTAVRRLHEMPHLVVKVAVALEILAGEVEYVLHKLNVENKDVHDSLRDLCIKTYNVLREGTYNPSEVKNLSSLLFEILAAWRDGAYLSSDPIQDTIKKI